MVGEVVGEGYADANPEAFDPTHKNYDPSLRATLKGRGETLAQVSAAIAAAFLDQNPNVAAHTAQNAVHENSFADHGVNRHSREKAADIASDFLDAPEGSSTDTLDNSVQRLAESLQKGLAKTSLVLTPEQYEAVAENIMGHVQGAEGGVKSLDMKAVVLQSLLTALEHDGSRLGRAGGIKLGSMLSDTPPCSRSTWRNWPSLWREHLRYIGHRICRAWQAYHQRNRQNCHQRNGEGFGEKDW